jgi:RND family efflux transporter MFP subunit
MLACATAILIVAVTPAEAAFESCPAVTAPARDLQLAFGVSGRVKRVHVLRGERVDAGELLAQLDDEDLAANVALLEIRAAGAFEIDAAQAAWRSASDTLARVKRAFEEEAAKERELRDAIARAEQTRAELGLAQQRQREAKLELAAAKARHEKTLMRATFAGVVEEVRIEAGGAVDELASVLRLVDESAFRIDVAVPTELTLGLRVGQTLPVRFRTAVPGGDHLASIASLAFVADAASRTRVVRLEMPNPAKLPAGLPVDVLVPKPTEEESPMLSGALNDDAASEGRDNAE